jgi:hypothetical protein
MADERLPYLCSSFGEVKSLSAEDAVAESGRHSRDAVPQRNAVSNSELLRLLQYRFGEVRVML